MESGGGRGAGKRRRGRVEYLCGISGLEGGEGRVQGEGGGEGGSEMEEGLIVTTFLALSERDGWRSRMGGIRPLRN